MEKQVNLTIDGRSVSVPAGMNLVDAAKTVGITIPVFCHHPKLKPVGMCRVCLVDVGRPQIDRATGQPVLNENGTPKIAFGPKLETACTTPVSEGMVVWGATEKVMSARKEIVEFLLTSHPLDCPVCDKGGECPLQNQTMEFGSGDSRFLLDEKSHAKKHYPLGELISLDRERCIQCARCVRFEDQVAGDPVIGFYNRGRKLEIATYSEPGFDSIFSGNTTDICPVGALTTNDFRFGARAWELKHKPSICNQCPVGCNITYDVRREAKSNGKVVVKRVMPRQNEEVNEIWICDKGRFTYGYSESPERLTQPLVRKNDELVPVSWDEALQTAAEKLQAAGKSVYSLVSGRLSLEDLYVVKTLTTQAKGNISLYSNMGGGEWVTRVGMTPGSDLSKLEKGSTILVFGSDLHEEAPIWWLRVKQAAERGVTLVNATARKMRLDNYASFNLSYAYGEEEKALRELFEGSSQAAKAVSGATDLVVFMGSDGMGQGQTSALAGLIAEGLVKTSHFGKPNNGLIPVWHNANDQGAYEMGIQPDETLADSISAAMALYVTGADPAGENPSLRDAMQKAGCVIVQDIFLTETAKMADVVLPSQAIMERNGTMVSGERRTQKFSAAVPAARNTKPDYEITTVLLEKLGGERLSVNIEELFSLVTKKEPNFKTASFNDLGATHEQWPLVGRNEVYYGGTGYENTYGLGVVLPLVTGESGMPRKTNMPDVLKPARNKWLALPVTHLYDQSLPVKTSLLKDRIANTLSLHPDDAEALKIENGAVVTLKLGKEEYEQKVMVSTDQPKGKLLVTRNCGVPVWQPESVEIAVTSTTQERGSL
ncbi:MAG TPA: NADH dehydrogenase (quinone) subunit G [Anaerolineaceae bacterium]|nr:NADH dehydrogenase (quinone) subunit G [Anaerolineaceae bacterium]